MIKHSQIVAEKRFVYFQCGTDNKFVQSIYSFDI